MVGKTKPATKAEKAHIARVKAMPCIACVKVGERQPFVTEAHHTLSGGRRRGHMQVLPCCSYHHRGLVLSTHSVSDMERDYGPSLALRSKAFHEQFGSDDELLAEIDEQLSEQALAE